MKRQSDQERRRRSRRRELFKKRMCLQDCGRPAQQGENLCQTCSDALCEQYFRRVGRQRPSKS